MLTEIYTLYVKFMHEAESEEFTGTEADQSFLVLQTKQQSKWLQKYGNTSTCMDATYSGNSSWELVKVARTWYEAEVLRVCRS